MDKIELVLSDEDIFELMNIAHYQNISPNQLELIENILLEYISHGNSKSN